MCFNFSLMIIKGVCILYHTVVLLLVSSTFSTFTFSVTYTRGYWYHNRFSKRTGPNKCSPSNVQNGQVCKLPLLSINSRTTNWQIGPLLVTLLNVKTYFKVPTHYADLSKFITEFEPWKNKWMCSWQMTGCLFVVQTQVPLLSRNTFSLI